ncbi:Phosphoribosylglycinamide formyltransferase [Pseudoalteromonas holothuriae]|uniref:Phosphoribosylglycinamide formyltransferase n=1 Tax=Pseudoalteromonas holothuriae TaxID=2963714 RepID=A0A9W4R1H3_9GAMM|nr:MULTISPECIES: formyltransferase family protein [unclassified Pseudoalteromonas]CAH9063855.1 Phosphoribosylglycinamide formyltransferase [Pseudoalteromonas sp. CIP111854]CAH9064581.1 Phosphoribosylglycinamide formyltransferase [Pseudoalteromonas sp. CIP111951]
MKTLYVLTEALFHTGYLVEKMHDNNSFDNFIFVVRDRNSLSRLNLDKLHTTYAGRTSLDESELQKFHQAYGGLSSAELSMISQFGIPEKHCLSATNTVVVEGFNCNKLQERVQVDSSFKCAAIFLDCILSDWWIDVFDGRIINAHSAVLPYARGMYAIEQFLLCATSEQVEQAAGATIHYVNSGIDKGNIIDTTQLQDLWSMGSIWAVKAASYMAAFSLLANYCNKNDCFSLLDAQVQNKYGPLFLAKNFTEQKRLLAEHAFLTIKNIEGIHYGAA